MVAQAEWPTSHVRAHRSAERLPPKLLLTPLEIELLDKLVTDKTGSSPYQSLWDYLIKVARLGGYLACAHDPPPGNTVMWRGLSRLADIELGYLMGSKSCG